jgi:hypothetical protein
VPALRSTLKLFRQPEYPTAEYRQQEKPNPKPNQRLTEREVPVERLSLTLNPDSNIAYELCNARHAKLPEVLCCNHCIALAADDGRHAPCLKLGSMPQWRTFGKEARQQLCRCARV